jgi:hypothetical protein
MHDCPRRVRHTEVVEFASPVSPTGKSVAFYGCCGEHWREKSPGLNTSPKERMEKKQ